MKTEKSKRTTRRRRQRCLHRHIVVRTERDGCSWVECVDCPKRGPAKHSHTLALIAWAMRLVDRHPRG